MPAGSSASRACGRSARPEGDVRECLTDPIRGGTRPRTRACPAFHVASRQEIEARVVPLLPSHRPLRDSIGLRARRAGPGCCHPGESPNLRCASSRPLSRFSLPSRPCRRWHRPAPSRSAPSSGRLDSAGAVQVTGLQAEHTLRTDRPGAYRPPASMLRAIPSWSRRRARGRAPRPSSSWPPTRTGAATRGPARIP